MNLDRLQDKLLESARNIEPDDRVPYGFHQKVMRELLATRQKASSLKTLTKGLWAACGPAVAITVIAFFVAQPSSNYSIAADLALEEAVLTPLMAEADIW